MTHTLGKYSLMIGPLAYFQFPMENVVSRLLCSSAAIFQHITLSQALC